MEAQSFISLENNQKYVGQELKVLIDRKEGAFYVGRTEFDSPDVDNEVLISAEDIYLREGDFAKVKIVSAEEYDLHAEVVEY
jgi:ribosomal protein S12 methylthiotransferase